VILPNATWTAPNAKAQTATDSIDSSAADRIALNKQYLHQATELFNQQAAEENNIKNIEKAKENATASEQAVLDQNITTSIQKIEQIQQQVQDLEKLNQALFVLPSDIEKNSNSADDYLVQKYVKKTSPYYVPNNPVVVVDPDLLNRTIVLVVNPDKIASDKSNLPSETSINGIPIHIRYGKIQLADCNPYDNKEGVCRPVIGGISTSQQSLSPNSLNTIGYAATWKDGSVGFVIAGHSAGAVGNVMVQPYDQPTDRIGVVKDMCTGFDCAFVSVDSGIGASNDIFVTNQNLLWQINGKLAAAYQSPGMFIAKTGATSGYNSGQILNCNNNNYYQTNGYCEASFDVEPGDSGGPAYASSGYATATLYGMVFSRIDPTHGLYETPDQIEGDVYGIQATPYIDGLINIIGEDCNNNPVDGMAVSIYNSNNHLLQSGYTPMEYTIPSSGTYTIDFSDYGSNTFSWAGPSSAVTSYTAYTNWGQATVSLSASQSYTIFGKYNTSYLQCPPPDASISITSQDLSGDTLTGLYMQLDQTGQQINAGWTPVTFNGLNPGTYTVYANDYCGGGKQYTFNHWSDSTTNRGDTITVSTSNIARTAYYSVSSC
jgi:hypothetical protein